MKPFILALNYDLLGRKEWLAQNVIDEVSSGNAIKIRESVWLFDSELNATEITAKINAAFGYQNNLVFVGRLDGSFDGDFTVGTRDKIHDIMNVLIQ